jgi:hypothetical protein
VVVRRVGNILDSSTLSHVEIWRGGGKDALYRRRLSPGMQKFAIGMHLGLQTDKDGYVDRELR